MEIWELVNEDGVPSGVLYERGSGEEIPKGLFFRVVEVFTKIGDKLLVTQRHPSKWMGLKWEATGGGVVVGEEIRTAAIRELFEETGIVALENEIEELGVKKLGEAMVYSFILRLSDAPSFNFDTAEVVDSRLVDEKEFIAMKDEFNPGTWLRYLDYADIIFNGDK